MDFGNYMARVPICIQRARELLQFLQEYGSPLFSVPENVSYYCFCIQFTNQSFGVNISCNPDVPYVCYDTALCDAQGNYLFYNDLHMYEYYEGDRFDTVEELLEEILRLESIGLPSS